MDKLSNMSSTLSQMLKGLVTNTDFLRHLHPEEYVSKSDEEIRRRLISGRCDSVCRWIGENLDDVDYYLLYNGSDDLHLFMKKDGLFYDGYNYNGVPEINQLEYVQTHINQKYNENDLYHISSGIYDRDKVRKIIK